MISTDTIEDNTRFAQMHDADYPILSDVTKEIGARYGVLGAAGIPKRWTFYIGPDGTILEVDKAVKAESSGRDMAARLAELKFAKRK